MLKVSNIPLGECKETFEEIENEGTKQERKKILFYA